MSRPHERIDQNEFAMTRKAGHVRGENPCAKCGGYVRYKSTRGCVACQKVHAAAARARKKSIDATCDDLIGSIGTTPQPPPANEWSDLL